MLQKKKTENFFSPDLLGWNQFIDFSLQGYFSGVHLRLTIWQRCSIGIGSEKKKTETKISTPWKEIKRKRNVPKDRTKHMQFYCCHIGWSLLRVTFSSYFFYTPSRILWVWCCFYVCYALVYVQRRLHCMALNSHNTLIFFNTHVQTYTLSDISLSL